MKETTGVNLKFNIKFEKAKSRNTELANTVYNYKNLLNYAPQFDKTSKAE